MTFKKLALFFGVAILPALYVSAQQQIGAIATPQINSTFYVGTITGFYPSIQSAVNAACATSGADVDIPAGTTPTDTIAAVAGGCTTAGIIDHRVIPSVSYAWVTSGYVAQGGGGGSSVPITGTPAAGNVPIASGPTAAIWGQLTQDDILPGFTIASFAGGSTVEVGATVTNPLFTAAYSSVPASANITNTDGTGSPLTLTTPFTSGTVTGAFTHTTATSTTFTLNATQGATKTATSAINWLPRTFAGVGTAGATGATATGTTAVLATATGTLTSAGLSNQAAYAASPAAQKIYILMTGGSHTFKDASTGFSFAFNTPTSMSFVNANGATVAMFLYESTNTLTGTFSIQVVN